ncbi:MAG: membrane fusion protein (multidrug efflux system) [Kiritimatiellia bacterium]|jgi:membrane fusion protein (multidrug efflux system)
MKKHLIKFLVLLLVGGGLFGIWYRMDSIRKQSAATPATSGRAGRPAPVVVTVVETRAFSSRIESVGTVRSDESIEISANVTETVTEILFQDGAVVTNGQVLALLSSAEEEASLQAAEANLADHQREIERLKDLVKQGAAPEIRLQARQTQAELAVQQILEARAKLQDRRITAPFAGMLGLRRISPGILITPGTVITTLDKIDEVKLDFSIPEIFLRELKPGLHITAQSAAYPDETFVGVVAHLDSRVDPVTRSITVRARFDNPGGRLRPGMLLTTTLEGDPRQSPGIPERAVISSGHNHYAFVLKSEGTIESVSRRKLELGRRVMGYVEALSGVEAGERLAADGLLGLRDGGTVEVIGTFDGPVAPFQPTDKSATQP